MATQPEKRRNMQGPGGARARWRYHSAPDQNVQKYGPCSHADLHSFLRISIVSHAAQNLDTDFSAYVVV